jgi:hypothetical protein
MVMKIDVKNPPRTFAVKGAGLETILSDCATIDLSPNEQVTFKTGAGAEYDVVRKSWGFYATPSTNGRLKSFGLRAAFVRSSIGRFFIMLVEKNKEVEFESYLTQDKQQLICWLDDEAQLARLTEAFKS